MQFLAESNWRERLNRSGYFFGALLLHILLFLMVATWVVFQATEHPVTAFSGQVKLPPPVPAQPPPAGGEAFNALEPSVTVNPPPAVSTVVSVSQANLFNVQAVKASIPSLPPSSSMPSGSALSGVGAAGPSAGAGNPFGQFSNEGNTSQLLGYLYDLKQTRDRKPTDMTVAKYEKAIKEMVQGNWGLQGLNDYYRGSKPLSTPAVFIPTITAQSAPKAFGLEQEVQPGRWIIWYHVKAAPTQDGDYRFVGVSDDVLLVGIDRHTVLDGSLHQFAETKPNPNKYEMTNFRPTCKADGNFWVGKSFRLRAGEKVEIDILMGELPGGAFNAFLYIQREQSHYAAQANGAPILPIFQVDANPIAPVGAAGTYPPFAATPEPWTTAER